MTPRQFLDEMVRPNVADFHRHIGSLRYAFNAIAAVDALAAHIYRWCEVNAPTEIASVADDTAYREELSREGHFRLVRDRRMKPRRGVVVLLLAAAALTKYLFFSKNR